MLRRRLQLPTQDSGPLGLSGNLPETNNIQPEPPIPSRGKTVLVLAGGALLAVAVLGAISGLGKFRGRR